MASMELTQQEYKLKLVKQKDVLHIGNLLPIELYRNEVDIREMSSIVDIHFWCKIGYLQYNPNMRNKFCKAEMIPKEALHQSTDFVWYVRADYLIPFLMIFRTHYAKDTLNNAYQRMTCAECPHMKSFGSSLYCDITGTDVIGYVESDMRDKLVYEASVSWCNQWEPKKGLEIEALQP